MLEAEHGNYGCVNEEDPEVGAGNHPDFELANPSVRLEMKHKGHHSADHIGNEKGEEHSIDALFCVE